MRPEASGKNAAVRGNALWGGRLGSGSSGSSKRFDAQWGKGGRGIVAMLALVALIIPASGAAHSASRSEDGNPNGTAVVPASLLAQAQANLAFTEADLARGAQLVKERTITEQTFDQRTQATAAPTSMAPAGQGCCGASR